MRVQLDADVLIGVLDADDPHHPEARKLFTVWHRQEATVLISAVNLTEVLVAPAAERTRLAAAREAIAALGVSVQQPGEAIAVEAARFRQRHPISLPDSYCVATAKQTGARVASFDERLRRAADAEGVALI